MAPKNKINLKDRLENGELDLSMSDLQEVPVKDIVQVKKATSLDLSNNRLTSLGKTFVTLTHLIKLDLSKNLLKELPDNFGEMKQLKHLDLYSNQITHLPLSFCELRNLRWLDLKNNPLVPAVAKIVGPCLDAQQCQQSARATVAFLTEMKEQVEEEKERIRIQELKELEAQQEKEKQQKKRNERKKAAKAKRKEMTKKEIEKEIKETETISQPKTNNSTLNNKEKISKEKKLIKQKSSTSFCFLLFLTLFSLTLLLFLISAANLFGPQTEQYRSIVINNWNDLTQKLPPSAQNYSNKFSSWIEKLHTFSGHQINNICVFLSEFNESEQVQIVKTVLYDTWIVTYNQSSVFLRTFSNKVFVLTDEIKKKIY